MSWLKNHNSPGWRAGAGALQVIASSTITLAGRDNVTERANLLHRAGARGAMCRPCGTGPPSPGWPT